MDGYIALICMPSESPEWRAVFPDLPGCTATGTDMDDVMANARQVLSAHLAVLLASGTAVPPPRQPADMLLDANEDPRLARRMVGAVLKAIVPEPTATLRLAVEETAARRGFYGEELPRRRA